MRDRRDPHSVPPLLLPLLVILRPSIISTSIMSTTEVANHPKIRLCFTLFGETHTVLEIPRNDFPRFSTTPLKWLLYVAYAIYGARGHLSGTAYGNEVDYAESNIEALLDCYYYVMPGKRNLLCIQWYIDSLLNRLRTATSC